MLNTKSTKWQWREEEWLWRDRRMSKAIAGPSHIKAAWRSQVLSSCKTTPAIYHYSKREDGLAPGRYKTIIEFHV